MDRPNRISQAYDQRPAQIQRLWCNRPILPVLRSCDGRQPRDRQPGAVLPESKCSFVQPTKRQAQRIGKVCGDSDMSAAQGTALRSRWERVPCHGCVRRQSHRGRVANGPRHTSAVDSASRARAPR